MSASISLSAKGGCLLFSSGVQKRGNSLPRAAIASSHLKTCTCCWEEAVQLLVGVVSQLEGRTQTGVGILPLCHPGLLAPTLKKLTKSTGYKVIETVPWLPSVLWTWQEMPRGSTEQATQLNTPVMGAAAQTNNKRDPRQEGRPGMVGLVPSLKSLDELSIRMCVS